MDAVLKSATISPSYIERIYVKLITALWQRQSTLQEDAIRRFHALEVDSMWQLYQLIKTVKEPKRRAEIFQHLLEEESHADMFCDVYQKMTYKNFVAESFVRKDVTGGNLQFYRSILAIHAGEKNATKRFKLLSQYLPEGPLQKAFAKIVEDESGHVELTSGFAEKLGVSKAEIYRQNFLLGWTRLSQRMQRSIGMVLNFIVLRVLMLGYWLFGWMAAKAAKGKFKQPLVVHLQNNNNKKVF